MSGVTGRSYRGSLNTHMRKLAPIKEEYPHGTAATRHLPLPDVIKNHVGEYLDKWKYGKQPVMFPSPFAEADGSHSYDTGITRMEHNTRLGKEKEAYQMARENAKMASHGTERRGNRMRERAGQAFRREPTRPYPVNPSYYSGKFPDVDYR